MRRRCDPQSKKTVFLQFRHSNRNRRIGCGDEPSRKSFMRRIPVSSEKIPKKPEKSTTLPRVTGDMHQVMLMSSKYILMEKYHKVRNLGWASEGHAETLKDRIDTVAFHIKEAFHMTIFYDLLQALYGIEHREPYNRQQYRNQPTAYWELEQVSFLEMTRCDKGEWKLNGSTLMTCIEFQL